MRTCCRFAGVRATALLLIGLAALSNAAAQVVAPVPVAQSPPESPVTRFGFPQEGWVSVRYSVLADGTTDNVTLIDKMPPQLVHRDAISAVESWVFRPATADGEPIDWHNNEAVILFDAEDVPAAPTPLFLQAYREVDALVAEGKLERALRSNERMLETSASRLLEIGLAEVQSATINLRLGDAHAAYAAILRATDPRTPTIAGDDLKIALQYRDALELQLGDVIGALETLERRNTIATVPADDLVAANVEAIEKVLNDSGTVVHQARIIGDVWRHSLDRRTFAITVVDGAIDAIDVACNRRQIELEYAADAEWMLPESWGACSVDVEGSNGTEFQFYEFP